MLSIPVSIIVDSTLFLFCLSLFLFRASAEPLVFFTRLCLCRSAEDSSDAAGMNARVG